MASRTNGITVTINGDTTGLSRALSSVNKEIKSTQSQLKDVEKLLKLDPGNTELLSQKQRLLAEAISETKDKLETLKKASEQANEALAKGEISQEQYDALQREIIETTETLEALEAQAKQSSTALEQIAAKGEKLKGIGENLTSAGEKMMPVTLAVAGIGAAVLKTAAEFDSGMSKVSAISGATGDDLDALRAKAREMGSKTKFSASEAASAMEYMAMAGWKTGDMLQGIEGLMNLAAASGENLADTSDIVTDALTAFGLQASDSGHFADVLAAASSNANTNVSLMGETFKYCAPIAGAMGYSVEDTAQAIGLMANAGIKASQAGTSLRTIMTKLNGTLQVSGKELGNVKIETVNTDGSMRSLSAILGDCRAAFSHLSESEKSTAASALVGKNAMSGFLALMNAGEEDVQKLAKAIEECDGSAEAMAETMQDNLAGQLTILKSQLAELAISLGEIMMPAIRGIVTALQGAVDWLNSLDTGAKSTIITIALVAAAIGPLLIVIGKVITAVGTIMTLFPKMASVINAAKTAFTAFSSALVAHPILAIVAAIAALVAAFVHLWNTNEGFRQFWIDLWENLKSAVSEAWTAISSFLAGTWETIKSVATTAWEGISGTVSTVTQEIGQGLSSAWTAISGFFSTTLQSIGSAFSTIWAGIQQTVTSVSAAISQTVTSAWNGIKLFFDTTLSNLGLTLSTAFGNMWEGVKSTMSGIVNSITSGLNSAVGFIQGLAGSAFSWGADIINGIVGGINSCIQKVKDAVSSVANAIRSFLHFSVPDEGPLTDFESWMPDFMSELAAGIRRGKSLVSDAVRDVAKEMVISPAVEANANMRETQASQTGSLGGILSGIEAIIGKMGNLKTAGGGDIVIPVYIGNTKIDELVVSATQRMNYRSGGH